MTGTSKEYAVALFELARERGIEKEVSEGLQTVCEVFRLTPDLTAFLLSPGIPKKTRLDALDKAFADGVPTEVLSFLSLLCEHGDVRLLTDAVNDYEALYGESRAVVSATVRSAVELTEDEKARLVEKMEAMSGKKVIAQYELDPALLGGMTVEWDGMIIDGSLKRRLHNIKEVMAE